MRTLHAVCAGLFGFFLADLNLQYDMDGMRLTSHRRFTRGGRRGAAFVTLVRGLRIPAR